MSESGVDLAQLSAGAEGSGWLLYFTPDRGPDQPGLVVHLSKESGADTARAEVYHALGTRETYVPVQRHDGNVKVNTPVGPAITLTALGGWWVRNGMTNYNLDIQINGPIYAMWGGGYDPETGPTRWTARIQPRQPAVEISVRDPQGEGQPRWDLRSLLPEFPKDAYYRTNYAERKCATPIDIEPGVSPLWPFVAATGSLEQPHGRLRPPIVVDWQKAHITHFSELVTVRNQNCSYSLYAINRLVPGEINQPSFETPFAFYDLSGEGNGYPNLILRTERIPAGEPWHRDGSRSTQNFVNIRYSWRNEVGDWLWDYKIGAVGFHPYTFETPVADGLALIDAPPYELYPQWVLERSWPVVTFIDTEGDSYSSSEGIYEWSPTQVGMDYAFGRTEVSNAQAFSDLTYGFRGEYRYRRNHHLPIKLYVSPVDNRVHLFGAEQGLWRLSASQVLRVSSLGASLHINSWMRERIAFGPGQGSTEPTATGPGIVEEALYALPDHLLLWADGNVTLRQAEYQPTLFEVQPPTDKASWQTFRAQVLPYTTQRRDPKDLGNWLSAFPGRTLTITGASVTDVRETAEGFRFVLTLEPGFQARGDTLLNLKDLEPGAYLVIYRGRFTVEPLTPPALSAALAEVELKELEAGTLAVKLQNAGLQDVSEATLEVWASAPDGKETLVTTRTVSLLAHVPVTSTLTWAPPDSGVWALTPKVRQSDGSITTLASREVTVAPDRSADLGTTLAASSAPQTLLLAVVGLITFAGIAAVAFWRQWIKA